MVRHGKQERYEDNNSPLGPEGELQAKTFANEIIANCGSNDQQVVIKIKSSSQSRASRTAEIIEQELSRKIQELGLTNIRILTSRESKDLKTTGALGPLMKAGIEYEDSVDEWLGNADAYPDAKKPAEAASQIKSMIKSADVLAKRIRPNGPKIVYIWVTHETGSAALLNEVTGENTEELGGSIGHLEPMKIVVSKNQEPVVIFRDQKFSLPTIKNEKS